MFKLNLISKILYILIFSLITSKAYAVTQWTVNVPTNSADLKSNFPAEALAQWSILQTLMKNYRQGYYLTYNSTTTLNISSGEVSVWNGSASLFLQNLNSQTATAANLDVGVAFSASTTYYVYAGTSSATAATATITISLSNTTPTGVTYYKQLGNFVTDSSSNISQIVDNSVITRVGSPITSYVPNTKYQATTDGQLIVCGACEGTGGNPTYDYSIVSDSSTTPSTSMGGCSSSSSTTEVNQCSYPLIRKGDYWKVTYTGSNPSIVWKPLGQ